MKQAFNFWRGWIVAGMLLLAPLLIHAQGGFDDNVTDNPVPFDGGVSLLVAAGIGYGLKKAHDRKKSQSDHQETEP